MGRGRCVGGGGSMCWGGRNVWPCGTPVSPDAPPPCLAECAGGIPDRTAELLLYGGNEGVNEEGNEWIDRGKGRSN